MSVEPVWGQNAPTGPVLPIRVTVQNDGLNRTGVITAKGAGISTTFVDMPRDSLKEVILYPATGQYGFEKIEITLKTQGGEVYGEVEGASVSGDPANHLVGLVSDTLGGFSFLRSSVYKGNRFSDAYLKPGLALDRAVGYEAVDLLILGEGAERLTDREVGALKRYALLGGTLIFMGGASSPILRDERWADVLPVRNPRATSKSSVAYLSQFGKVPGNSIAITDVDPLPDAVAINEGGTTIYTRRTTGIGSVIVLGFNLTEQPLSKWEGRLPLLYSMAISARKSESAFKTFSPGYRQYLGGNQYDMGSPSMGGMPPPVQTQVGDPFRAELPPTATIFFILLGFWIVVIPIHFFILNRLKKGELAWFTAPLIALAFAGLLFTMASGLYKSGLSSALEGILIKSHGSEEAVFAGRQQLFFPSGGRYNLGFQGVEAVLPTGMASFSMPGRRTDTSFQNDIKDVGEIVAESASATNLNFKEFRFVEQQQQNWSIPRDFKVTFLPKKILIQGTLTNQSPYAWKTVAIWVDDRTVTVGADFAAGTTKPFKIDVPTTKTAGDDVSIAVWAQTETLEAGARIGKPALGRYQEIFYSFGSQKLGGS